MLSQPKIDLAVLYKLHRHADEGGEAITPEDVSAMFAGHFPYRRIEVALAELSRIGDVDREYHSHYSDEGLWQISRAGIRTVDRALAVPVSFIARLHANGDHWLTSEEAHAAVLNKKTSSKSSDKPLPSSIGDEKIEAVSTMAITKNVPQAKIDWTKWGTIFSAVGIAVTIIIWMLS